MRKNFIKEYKSNKEYRYCINLAIALLIINTIINHIIL